MVTRFVQLPRTLYRIQPKLQVSLRSFEAQQAKKRTSYDLKLHDGLVLPAQGDTFIGPNGMSLRPMGPKMVEILKGFKGNPRVYALLEGMTLPEGLIVLHEHSDHYSMQTTKPITLDELNEKMTQLLSTVTSVTRDEFLAQLEDEDDQDN